MTATEDDFTFNMDDEPVTPKPPDGTPPPDDAPLTRADLVKMQEDTDRKLREQSERHTRELDEANARAARAAAAPPQAPPDPAAQEAAAAAFKNRLIAEPAQTVIETSRAVAREEVERGTLGQRRLAGEQFLEGFRTKKRAEDRYAGKVLPIFDKLVGSITFEMIADWEKPQRDYQLETFYKAAWGEAAQKAANAKPKAPEPPDLGNGRGGGGSGGGDRSAGTAGGAFDLIRQMGQRAGLKDEEIEKSIKAGVAVRD